MNAARSGIIALGRHPLARPSLHIAPGQSCKHPLYL